VTELDCAPRRRGAAQQRDAADEGRLELCGSTIVGNEIIMNQGRVVRPSQLIASVGPTRRGRGGAFERLTERGWASDYL
jgi:hypothetical protein